MTETVRPLDLPSAPDFSLGGLRVSPSTCRVFAGGGETRIEAQTMLVLVVLTRAEGATVSRDALVAACWQGRIVSDDAIGRTIAKVRAISKLMDGAGPAPFTLETLPKVGYRLVAAAVGREAPIAPARQTRPVVSPAERRWKLIAMAAMGIIAIPVISSMVPRDTASVLPGKDAILATTAPNARDVTEALWLADEGRLRDYMARGWDPNWQLDAEGNTALHILFAACERNPTHDKSRVVRVAQLLIAAGVSPTAKNGWGDAPIDIASSPRYCGPKHPVVEFLRTMTPDGPAADKP